MSTTARLAAFVAGLAIVFAASFGLGAGVGPDRQETPPTTTHTDHTDDGQTP